MISPSIVDLNWSAFVPLGLQQVKQAELMNRQEHKFMLTVSQLPTLLERLHSVYRVLTIEDTPVQQYHTRYYDTDRFGCYLAYQNDRPNRYKVRWRQYVTTGASFLEIKQSRHRRTLKTRVVSPDPDQLHDGRLLLNHAIDASALRPALDVTYDRVTLVRTGLVPERLTLDFNLRLTGPLSGAAQAFPDLVIAELKSQVGLPRTCFSGVARLLELHSAPLSKYGVGCALHHPELRRNRVLPQLRRLNCLQMGER